MGYLEREVPPGDCFLCAAGAGPSQEGLVVWRGRLVFALLNAFPYVSGHVLVAPYDHEGDLLRLPADAAAELVMGARLVMRALALVYAPEGYNLGANLGSAAGAGHAEHLHLHVVPRWRGDTNFMTTAAETRVVPEALHETADRLRRAVVVAQETA